MTRALQSLVKCGIIIKKEGLYKANPSANQEPPRGRWGYKSHEGDKRTWPRIGKKYFKIEDLAEEVLRETGSPLPIEEIMSKILAKIIIINRR